jgi:CheY-like chemotaxis protein
MLKPARREQLTETLGQLERRLDRAVRRVLVVEDDPAQLSAVRHLLAVDGVETTGAASGAECLARLAETTFDCMVLDLALPDMSGFDLLDRLSNDPGRAFPPVIVYTGRDLDPADELRLRRYSSSIIVKGARSPERLLDEVTLFLHQVVAEMPGEQQRTLARALSRDAAIDGRRILVAEDDVRNVFALSSILEPHGATVLIARNGREAIAALQRAEAAGEAVDLVLMDVMMPEMDGLAAMREIRRNPAWRGVPVIALTAKAMPDDQSECLAAGANDYMPKPLDVEKLLSLVRVWMPRR